MIERVRIVSKVIRTSHLDDEWLIFERDDVDLLRLHVVFDESDENIISQLSKISVKYFDERKIRSYINVHTLELELSSLVDQ